MQTESVQPAIDFRTRLLEAGGCSFDLSVRVNYGEEAADFSLACTYDTDGTASMEVTAPETLAGIRAGTDGEGTFVQFEDVRLALADVAEGKLAPMSSPRLLGSCWQEAYISATCTEEGNRRVTYLFGYDKDELTVDCWFTPENVPVHAEISYEGLTVLQADITAFSFTKGDI